jgi:hypothetical protein
LAARTSASWVLRSSWWLKTRILRRKKGEGKEAGVREAGGGRGMRWRRGLRRAGS